MRPFTLFVYGNLMRNRPRASVLKNEQFLRPARTAPFYRLLDLGQFPGLVRVEAGGEPVHGELYQVRASLRVLLERIEGSPDLLRLDEVEIDGFRSPVVTPFCVVRISSPRYVPGGVWPAGAPEPAAEQGLRDV